MRTRRAAELADLLTAAGLEAQVAGNPDDAVGPGVVIDSRQVSPGALFVALPGERTDGHDFVGRAADAGAGAALVTRPVGSNLTQIVVPDAREGLTALARTLHSQARTAGLTTVAVTGSAGKTSTKDILAQVLEAAGPTVSPVGSFNNELGTPLTVCQVDDRTRYLVCEMGARAAGDVRHLCSIARPTVGMVLNVGSAHLGEFGSREAIAQAKGEMVEALDSSGWAVLNADDPLVDAMATRTVARIARFTLASGNDVTGDLVVRVTGLHSDDLDRHGFTLSARWADGAEESVPVTLGLIGRHQVANAAAAATAALAAGVRLDVVGRALSDARVRSPWRMELHELPSGAAVINDAYNANPESMAAALNTLSAIAVRRRATTPGARAFAILGDMLELGPDAAELHQRVGELAGRCGIDEVLAIGEHAEDLVAGAEAAGARAQVTDRDRAGSLELRSGDIVLVKASRGLSLEVVADRLAGGEVTR